MTDFLGTAIWIFEFLVMGLLPVVAIGLVAIYIYRIIKAIGNTTEKFIDESFSQIKKE